MSLSSSSSSRVLSLALFVAFIGSACGGLRRQPLTDNDDGGPGGSTTGVSGSGGGAAGRGGSSAGGSGGSVAGSGGSGATTGVAGNDGGVSPDAPTCMAGGACVPANPCHKGATVCMEGAMSCNELPDLLANGSECGTDRVCNNGTCTACQVGMACNVTGKPCRVGTMVCTTGAPVCTETDNKPNGMSCGSGMVCQSGACVACAMGAACEPTNRCHTGTLMCTGGTPTCMDTNINVAPGSTCGQDRVCNAGTCTDCTVGAACNVTGKPCRRGTTACNTGAPVCLEAGDQPNGSVCGTGLVCQAGACVACTAGPACVPANPCHAGVTVCSPTIGCSDTGSNLANGTSCGTDRVCNAGACGACAAGSACQPANVCKTGATTCATGSPVCVESGNRPNGTSCGTNMVCTGGACMTCSAGTACVPANPCHNGTLSCSTGSPVCTDSGTNVADGTACGTNLVCRTGSCMSCTAGQACQPQNPCKNGMTSCATGVQTCVETTNKTPGTLCGAGQSCSGGVLTLPAMCTAAGACMAATMTCTSGACNPSNTDCSTCPAGQMSCPTGCRDLQRDVLNCGSCGNACPAPAAGTGIAVCTNGQCGFDCNPGYLKCIPLPGNSGAHCQRQVWDFEDQSVGGLKSLLSPTAIQSMGLATRQAHEGRYSLGMTIKATGTGTSRGFLVGVAMCGGQGYIPAQELTVMGWMYLEPTDTKQTLGRSSRFGMRVNTEKGDGLNPAERIEYNTWFFMETPVAPIGGEQLLQIGAEGFFASDIILPVGEEWTGTVYIDDLLIK